MENTTTISPYVIYLSNFVVHLLVCVYYSPRRYNLHYTSVIPIVFRGIKVIPAICDIRERKPCGRGVVLEN
tara:strand:+ start:2530 stop:2742 length:213 start_codon:yes stop_codon:yes gene_type:complete